MKSPFVRAPVARGAASTVVLGASVVALALVGGLGFVGAAVGAGSVVAAAIVRRLHAAGAREYAVGVALVGAGGIAVLGTIGPLSELLAGAVGVASVAWLADDPTRRPGALGRAASSLLLVAGAVVLAWVSATALPSGAAPIGVAAVLLIVVLAVAAVLLGRPAWVDPAAATS